jgi:hypothetical protein
LDRPTTYIIGIFPALMLIAQFTLQRFVRLGDARDRDAGRIGLGLSIVTALARNAPPTLSLALVVTSSCASRCQTVGPGGQRRVCLSAEG